MPAGTLFRAREHLWPAPRPSPLPTGRPSTRTICAPAWTRPETPSRRPPPAWQSPLLDGHLYGQSLVYAGRVFAATENNTVYALAANSGAASCGRIIWPPRCRLPALPCGDITPTVGITSTPVIDPARSEIFVVADEAARSPDRLPPPDRTQPLHRCHLLDEVIDPPGINPATQLQRALAGPRPGNVIIGLGGNSGDCGSYHGLVISAPENGRLTFISPTSQETIRAVVDGRSGTRHRRQGNIWVATGNSDVFARPTPTTGARVLKLSPSLKLLDFFAHRIGTSTTAPTSTCRPRRPCCPMDWSLLPEAWTRLHPQSVASRAFGGHLQTTPDFCGDDPDGGIADLNGLLFVPCRDGLRAVRPTASSPPKAIWHTTIGPNSSPIIAGGLVWSIANGTVGNQGDLYALNPQFRCRGAEIRRLLLGIELSFAFGRRWSHSGPRPVTTFMRSWDPAGLPGPPSPPPSTAGLRPCGQ